MDKKEKIRKWLDGELSASEKKNFEATDEFAQFHRLLNAVNKFAAPDYDVDEAYENLSKNLKAGKKKALYSKVKPIFRVAAVFIFMVLLAYFIYDQAGTQGTESEWVAQQNELFLPDSSSVTLNADSRIRFAAGDWEMKRKVELQGEAFFRVKKGSRFEVKTDQGKVIVLGTEFSIKDRNSYYEVTCFSGSVKVQSDDNSVILQPGSAFRIMNKKVENYLIADKSIPDWLKGESSFKSVPLQYVLNELERQYRVDVQMQNIDPNQLFSGSFPHDNLELALESVTFPVNLDYQINGKKIEITFEGN